MTEDPRWTEQIEGGETYTFPVSGDEFSEVTGVPGVPAGESESIYTRRALVVVEASDLAAANAAAGALNPGGGNTFVAALSPDGREPATHYWCNVALPESLWLQVLGLRNARVPTARVFDGNTTTGDDVLGELGLKRLGSAFEPAGG